MTPTTTPQAFTTSFRLNSLYEELAVWTAQGCSGVVVRATEEHDGERSDAVTILNDRNATRLLGWLAEWFASLPLTKRAELADAMPAGVVADRDRAFLRIVAASERNRRDYPGIGFEPAAVSVTELPR